MTRRPHRLRLVHSAPVRRGSPSAAARPRLGVLAWIVWSAPLAVLAASICTMAALA